MEDIILFNVGSYFEEMGRSTRSITCFKGECSTVVSGMFSFSIQTAPIARKNVKFALIAIPEYSVR